MVSWIRSLSSYLTRDSTVTTLFIDVPSFQMSCLTFVLRSPMILAFSLASTAAFAWDSDCGCQRQDIQQFGPVASRECWWVQKWKPVGAAGGPVHSFWWQCKPHCLACKPLHNCTITIASWQLVVACQTSSNCKTSQINTIYKPHCTICKPLHNCNC